MAMRFYSIVRRALMLVDLFGHGDDVAVKLLGQTHFFPVLNSAVERLVVAGRTHVTNSISSLGAYTQPRH